MPDSRFRPEWWDTEVIGMRVSVTMYTLHGPFPYAARFADPMGHHRSPEELYARIIAIEEWCEDAFGPRARYDRHTGQIIGGTWWSTEANFRFADETEAAAFKLFWM